MNGAVRNFLLDLSRGGGSRIAGINADDEEADATVEQALEHGVVRLQRSAWATGDFYVLTRKGWDAIGIAPPPDWREPATFRDLLPIFAILAILAAGSVIWRLL